MIEIWKDIDGYEGIYEISNTGRVRSIYYMHGRDITPYKDKSGYMIIRLVKNGKMKRHKMHRILATAFIPNPENKQYINHIDGVKTNNSLSNLEWVTHKENMDHAWKNKLLTIKDAHRMRNITQTFNARKKYKWLQGQQFGSILILGNITFDRGSIKADVKCLRCGSIKKNKNIRAELKGNTRMCISCKNKSMGRLRKYNKHKDIVSSALKDAAA